MANTSATGGYLSPNKPALNLTQFIQTVIVGISGIQGQLVRPKWQKTPPIQPGVDVNWIAFGISIPQADANAYVGIDEHDVTTLQRMETLEIACSVYGPDCLENFGILRDGFQIQQNLAALRSQKMGFKEVGRPIRAPELTNEQWVDRIDASIILVREVRRVYQILPFVSASGNIQVVLSDGKNTIDWLVEPEDT